MKNKFLFILLFISLAVFAKDKPNVIVVLADDVGLGDVSHYRRLHSDNIIVETPNIDKLANAGVVFTQAHAPAALCAPSRYGMMTGNSCYRSPSPHGVWGSYELSPIKDKDLTLGRLMQSVGYQTAFFGKWHLGGDYKRLSDPSKIYRAPRTNHERDVDITKIIDGPQQKGFDYSFTMPAGIQDMPYAVYENGEMVPIKDDSEVTFITQLMMDKLDVKLDKEEGLGDSNWDPHIMGPMLVHKAVDYIKAQSNKKKPFFMYYCSQAVHLPHTPSDSLDGIKIKGTTPSAHLDMVKELDVQMGMMIKELKAQGVYDNTIFVFTSDNGGLQRRETIKSGHKSSSIYRGGKNTRFEGGHRVPFIVSWPKEIKHHQTNAPILALDVMATLAAVTKGEINAGQAMDSYNLLPILKEKKNAKSHAFLMVQSGTGKELIIIEEGWKLILKSNKEGTLREPMALYDLNTNPEEKEDLNYIDSPEHKSKIDALLKKYNQTRDSKIKTSNMASK
ncbi:sulfatase family protein [Labilibacter marinus]|uniref:sulfatase family protein n=1 Tax=Labilibacter marinus TaxID=1477105 RepID=UPI00095032AE|nr:arylsulfatase [Labilibacter marinus]